MEFIFVHYQTKFHPLPNFVSSITKLNSVYYQILFHPLMLLRIALKSAGHSGGKLPPAQPM